MEPHANCYDVIVIGGGHNGLVTAALLAKQGRRVILLERRAQLGGAAITEQPFGPDFKITSLSYVVSLLPQAVVRELELERHGYKVYPQHGYFAAYPDGRYLQLPGEQQRRQQQVAKFSRKDAAALGRWDAWLGELGAVLGPLLTQIPPRLGSKSPRALRDQLGLLWWLRNLSERQLAEIARLFTSSIADLLEDRFESPELRGLLAVSGIIGTWAGPRAPGTAYVMAHHKIGDVGDGQLGSWGFPQGGMGGVTTAMAKAATAFGATLRPSAPVARILVKKGRAHGVVLESGEELYAPVVVATAHPKITFLRHLEPQELPAEFRESIERWKTRSGTVKINLALDRLPEFTAKPGFDPEVHGGTIVLVDSLDELEHAFQDAVAHRAAERPFADICIPSVFDPTLAPPGKHVMSLFTQWVPRQWADAPHTEELDAYADRVLARVEELAPGFKSSILHRQVIGPHKMQEEYGLVGGNIFHGELSVSQLFHLRPAPGYADFRTPVRGLYQASSATHGGGGVTAIPALQAVGQILAGR